MKAAMSHITTQCKHRGSWDDCSEPVEETVCREIFGQEEYKGRSLNGETGLRVLDYVTGYMPGRRGILGCSDAFRGNPPGLSCQEGCYCIIKSQLEHSL